MRTRLLTLLCLAPLGVTAQQRTFDIALSYGGYTSTILYQPNQFKTYFSADFDYHLSNRWTVSSALMSGTFGYYDSFPVKLVNGTYSEKPNSQGFDFHGNALLKYAAIATSRFTLQLGTGMGLYTQRLVYPYQGNTYEASYAADFEVPLTVEGFYRLAQRVGFGIKAGCSLQPDIRGMHIGPQIRVRL